MGHSYLKLQIFYVSHFKKFYRIIITLEIVISSLCYYISTYQFGYIIYCIISAFVNSASMAIGPTNFSIIFDNEKGALLFGISCFLTNTFYIFRPLISNLLTEKIYYLIIYLIIVCLDLSFCAFSLMKNL